MAKIDPDKIRNIALLGHSHDGKTSLAEAMLYAGGTVDRLGKPDAGNTTFDFEPEETKRKISIGTAIAHLNWRDHKINVLDSPGFQDFVGEVSGALRAAEGALLVVSANSGVVVGTELAWELLRNRNLPTLIVVNKMDKENADFWKAVDTFKEYEFDDHGKPKEVPIPREMAAEVESRRSPLVEAAAETDDALLERYLDTGELSDADVTAALAKGVAEGGIVPVLSTAAGKAIGVGTLLDAVVSLLPSPRQAPPVDAVNPRTDQTETVSADPNGPLAAQIFKTTADPFVGRISYVKVVSGTLTPGTPLINASKDQPERPGAIGFPKGKKLEPVTEVVAGDIAGISKLQVSVTGDTLAAKDHPLRLPAIEYPPQTYSASVSAKNKADEEKVNAALVKLVDEDPTLTLVHEPITKESIVQGMGDVHLDVVLEKMKRKYGVEAGLSVPKVPYQETIVGSARAEKKYKKQSGGAGLYGHCVIEIAPVPRGTGFVWEDKIFGGSIPQNFRPSVEKGVRETMEQGVLTGNPLVDIKVSLLDGSTHPVDGKDIAFKLAGAMAMRQAVMDARPVLLEPIMEVEVLVPERNMGDVISDLNGKRGKIAGMEPSGDHMEKVKAQVPLSSMYRFPIDLRSMTQGRGRYTMKFSHYEEVPAHAAQTVIAAYQKSKGVEEEE